MRQMVDVPLESFDFSHQILLSLLQLLDHVSRATCTLFHVETLLIQSIVLLSQLLDGLLVPLRLCARITVILQHILLINFKSSQSLLGHSFLILQSLRLPLKEFVSLR